MTLRQMTALVLMTSTFLTSTSPIAFANGQGHNPGRLGVEISNHTDGAPGVRILRVFEGRPGWQVGLRSGDVVVAADGQRLTTADEMVAYIGARANKPVELTVLRNGAIYRGMAVPIVDEAPSVPATAPTTQTSEADKAWCDQSPLNTAICISGFLVFCWLAFSAEGPPPTEKSKAELEREAERARKERARIQHERIFDRVMINRGYQPQ